MSITAIEDGTRWPYISCKKETYMYFARDDIVNKRMSSGSMLIVCSHKMEQRGDTNTLRSRK